MRFIMVTRKTGSGECWQHCLTQRYRKAWKRKSLSFTIGISLYGMWLQSVRLQAAPITRSYPMRLSISFHYLDRRKYPVFLQMGRKPMPYITGMWNRFAGFSRFVSRQQVPQMQRGQRIGSLPRGRRFETPLPNATKNRTDGNWRLGLALFC
jgi:hypothetical protein